MRLARGAIASMVERPVHTSVDSTTGGFGIQATFAQGPFPTGNFTFYAQFKNYEFNPEGGGQEYQSLLMLNQYNTMPDTNSLANCQLYFHTPTQAFVAGAFDQVSPHETHQIATKAELGDKWFAGAFSCNVDAGENTVFRWKLQTVKNGEAWQRLDYDPGTLLKARGPMQQAWVLQGAGGESPRGAFSVQAFICGEVLTDAQLDTVRNFKDVIAWASYYGVTLNRYYKFSDVPTAAIDLVNGYNANPNGTGATSLESPFR